MIFLDLTRHLLDSNPANSAEHRLLSTSFFTIKQYITYTFLQVVICNFFINAFLLNLEVIYRLSFPIYVLFTASLFRFPCYLQAPFSISMLITGSLFRFPYYLQAPFFDFHVIYRLPFTIYALFTGFLFQFTCYLQPFYSIYRNNLHLIYMISSLCSQNLQCFCHYLHISLQTFTCFLHGTSETCKRGKIM